MDLKLILFDIGGVLIEYTNVFKTASTEQNIPQNLIDETFDKYDSEITRGKITPQELYLNCVKENNLNSDNNYNFLSSWLNDYAQKTPAYNLLINLTARYDIGLLSNIYKGMVPILMQKKLIPDIPYKYYFLSCDLGMRKPDKEIYEHVQTETKLEPGEILLIDDKDENLKTADFMGWQTHKFQRTNPEKSAAILTTELLYGKRD